MCRKWLIASAAGTGLVLAGLVWHASTTGAQAPDNGNGKKAPFVNGGPLPIRQVDMCFGADRLDHLHHRFDGAICRSIRNVNFMRDVLRADSEHHRFVSVPAQLRGCFSGLLDAIAACDSRAELP